MNEIQMIKEKYGQQAESIIANGLGLYNKNKKYRCPNRQAHKRGDKIPSMSWHPEAHQFHCFACNMNIDIYGYYREHLNYSHKEVIAELLGDDGYKRFEEERKTFETESKKVTALNDNCINYISQRGIKAETIKHFNLKMYNNSIAFEYSKHGTVIGYKIRKPEKNPAGAKMYGMTGSKPFLYNFDNLDEDKSELIICEGEFDCMVLWQCGYNNVVSVGAGANSLRALFEQAKEFLSSYKNIIVVSDNDDAGTKMDEIFINEFGIKARLIDKNLYTQNDVNAEYFKNGEGAIVEIIESARLKIEGRRDLDKEPYKGFSEKSNSYIPTGIDELDNAINDLVSGRVTVIVGRTNAGKTTFTKQIISNAIDKSNKVFCVSGEGDIEVFINDIYKTVIGRDKRNYNFIKDNKRLVKEPKPEVLRLLQNWHKGKLVLFSKGESRLKSMDELFSMLSMEIKLKRHNLVVIDNLMSLLTVSNSKDKNEAQGEFVQRCCDIAKAYNTHIIIVVHPRKGQDNEISIENISGSMDIGNKADNVIAVTRNYDDEEFHDGTIKLLKNRYYSDLVEVRTKFDAESGLLLGINNNDQAVAYNFNVFNKKMVNDLEIDLDCPF